MRQKATRMWLTLLCALAGGALPAQTIQPLGVTSSRIVATMDTGVTSARMGLNGDVYLTGPDGSNWGPAGKTYGDGTTGSTWVSRRAADGTSVFTTAIGAASLSIAGVDSSGNVFLTGYTRLSGFYTSPGAYRSSNPSSITVFSGLAACKLNGSDGSVVYCTYLDYYGTIRGSAIVDSDGSLIVVDSANGFAGLASEPNGTPGSFHQGSNHIYVAKLNPSGSALTFTAMFGGTRNDSQHDCALDSAGNIYISGQTDSKDFPGTTIDPGTTGTTFVSKLSADGKTLFYSALGAPGDSPLALAVNTAGEPQLAYSDSTKKASIRRYRNDGSAILFDTKLGATLSPTGTPIMTVDTQGVTTLVAGLDGLNATLLHPTQSCAGGFMARLDSSGVMTQATFLAGTGNAGYDRFGAFSDLAAQSAALKILVLNLGSDNFAASTQVELLSLSNRPDTHLTCLANAASYTGTVVSGGEIISLFGQSMTPAAPAIGYPDSSGKYPTSLGALQVTFDGVPAPLLYTSAGQINTVVPFGVQTTTNICVQAAFTESSCMKAKVQTAVPGFFVVSGGPEAYPYAAAVNQDGTINSEQNPAPRGSIVALFATGLGALTSTPADGTIVGLPLLTQKLDMTMELPIVDHHVNINWERPQWVGQAPFEIAGLSQVNVTVPQVGNVVDLLVFVGSRSEA